jgi:hypothetical protein
MPGHCFLGMNRHKFGSMVERFLRTKMAMDQVDPVLFSSN